MKCEKRWAMKLWKKEKQRPEPEAAVESDAVQLSRQDPPICSERRLSQDGRIRSSPALISVILSRGERCRGRWHFNYLLFFC